MMRLLIGLLIAASFSFGSTLNYTLTGGSDVITFGVSTPAAPISCNYAGNCFGLAPINLTINGAAVSDGQVNFYEGSEGGGLTILSGSTLLVNNNGTNDMPLFSGNLATPVLTSFSSLSLEQESYGAPVYDEAFTLNATPSGGSTAPEPGAIWMMAGGLLLVACGCRKLVRQ